LPIVDWVETNRHLSKSYSYASGPIDLTATPYVKEILEAFASDQFGEVVLMFASQCAKTTTLENMVYYSIVNTGVPVMWVSPEGKARDDLVQQRFEPTIMESPALAKELKPGKRSITRDGIDFRTCKLYMALANSESDLAGRSCGLLVLDEINKFPARTRNEGSPIDQARARGRTFPNFKVITSSTPTTEDGAISKNYAQSDQREHFVPCPKCGKFHQWETKDIRWTPKEERPAGMEQSEFIRLLEGGHFKAWWECPSCGHKAETEAERFRMNQGFKFVAQNPGGTKAGFRVQALASPSPNCSFQNYAVEYLKAKHAEFQGDVDPLRHFRIHWEAKPYKEKSVRFEESAIVERCSDLPMGVFPDWVDRITCGMDVQQDCVYYVVVGWNTARQRPHVGLWGRVDLPIGADQTEITRLVNMKFGGRPISATFIDSSDGNTMAEVYNWTNRFNSLAVHPIKGRSTKSGSGKWIARSEGREHRNKLFIINTIATKDFWSALMSRDASDQAKAPVSFAIDAVDDKTFQRQISAAEKLEDGTWGVRTGYRDDHYGDSLYYATAAAVACGIIGRKTKRKVKVVVKNG
jgi:phage terminase large subunit GpA-like protein